MDNTVTMWITDKNNGVYFRTLCGIGFHQGEMNNLKKHIEQAKKHPDVYHFLDAKSAVIKTDGSLTYADIDMSDDELLKLLLA